MAESGGSNDMFGWNLLYKTIEKDLTKKSDVIVAVAHWSLVKSLGLQCLGLGEDVIFQFFYINYLYFNSLYIFSNFINLKCNRKHCLMVKKETKLCRIIGIPKKNPMRYDTNFTKICTFSWQLSRKIQLF